MAKVHKIDLLQKATKSKSILEDPVVCLSVDNEHRVFHRDGRMGFGDICSWPLCSIWVCWWTRPSVEEVSDT